ncbi:DsbC family protein [Klebsiella aerogenes]
MITANYTQKRLNILRDDTVLFSLCHLLECDFNLTRREQDIIIVTAWADKVLYHAADNEEAIEILTVLGNQLVALQHEYKMDHPHTDIPQPKCPVSRLNRLAIGLTAVLGVACLAGAIWVNGESSGISASAHALTPGPASVKSPSRIYLENAPAPFIQPAPAPVPAAPPSLRKPQPTKLTPEEFHAAQAALATNLKTAAGTQTFSVSLSSGHPRTLYVFADPECPNCRIFEPTLQALSGSVNIEIFPVTLVGKEDTARKVVPLLCAPSAARAVLWRELFDVGAGMRDLDHPPKALPECKTGQLALDRNDKAMRLFHFPGTPTVISDDGRMVPFIAMKSVDALDTWLKEKP